MNDPALSIPVDRASPVPLYYQVAQYLEQAIASGELPAGTLLGNEILLADQLGLSRPTLRRAIQYLVDRGLLVRRRGVGTVVMHAKVRRPLELTSLYDDLEKTSQRPRTAVLSFSVEGADENIAQVLGVPEGTEVYAFERLRFADDEPLALMRNYQPTSVVPLTAQALTEKGLYQIIRAQNVQMKIAEQSVGARAATATEARLLGELPNAPLLTMTRTTYADTGRVVEHGSRASRYSFQLPLVAN